MYREAERDGSPGRVTCDVTPGAIVQSTADRNLIGVAVVVSQVLVWCWRGYYLRVLIPFGLDCLCAILIEIASEQ